MRRTIAAVILAAFLPPTATACFGGFELTKKVWQFQRGRQRHRTLPRVKPDPADTDEHRMVQPSRQGGFSLVEAVMVVAIIGVLASLTMVVSARWALQEEPRQAALVVAGVLQAAQERARTEGHPVLVFFHEEVDCSDGRDPILTVVGDVDRTFDQTPPDSVTPVSLPADMSCEVTALGTGPEAVPATLRLPDEDYSQLVTLPISPPELPSLPSVSSVPLPKAKLAAIIQNGTTFAPDLATGDPVLAFATNGSPVHPSVPTNWGSGTGAIYITNNRGTIYAIIITPTGAVTIRRHDLRRNRWQ